MVAVNGKLKLVALVDTFVDAASVIVGITFTTAFPVANVCVDAFVEVTLIVPLAPLVAVDVSLTYIVVELTVPLDCDKETLRIDLWTKDMPVDEKIASFHQPAYLLSINQRRSATEIKGNIPLQHQKFWDKANHRDVESPNQS